MNCNHVQNLLSSFCDRELSADETRELRKHLFTCPECDREYQELLMLKRYLENIVAEPLDFDPMENLRARFLETECSFLPPSPKMVWLRRLSLVAACIAIYLVTTSLLFPPTQNGPKLAAERPRLLTAPVSWDQNFSIDQSISVYQASMILP
ncbi:MAG: anti-sigma factor family protein [Bacillota bacterium]